MTDLPGLALGELDPALDVVQLVAAMTRAAEARHPQQRGAPVGDGAEVVDEPAQRGLHLREGAAAIIRPPKESLPAKYSGAATRIGATRVNQP